ncbi:hypothetical protein [Spiroplasma endosymbiont of Melieria omissa]|uniref:hypothetical protein n=1 Tax=Spiroplasma endosymbiont of Melieria omissa TaxID=3139324 RepID=UPI003CCB0120
MFFKIWVNITLVSYTTYIESSTGVAQGARTGFSAIITGTMFLIAIILYPIWN